MDINKAFTICFVSAMMLLGVICTTECSKPRDEQVERMQGCRNMCGFTTPRYVDSNCTCAGGE